MAKSLSDEIAKALSLIDGKTVANRSAAVLRKNKAFLIDEMSEYIISKFKIDKGFLKFKGNLFKSKNIQKLKAGASQLYFAFGASMNLLAFPHKIAARRRKDGTVTSRRVLKSVDIGLGFTSMENSKVFVEQGNGGIKLAMRRKDTTAREVGRKEPLFVPISNPVSIMTDNPKMVEDATKNYTDRVLLDLGKRLVREMYKRANKRVKFKVGA